MAGRTTVTCAQKNSFLEYFNESSGTTRHASRTQDQHPNRSQSSPQSSFPLDIGPISPTNTRVSSGQKISISKYPNERPGTTRHTSRTQDQHSNRSQSSPQSSFHSILARFLPQIHAYLVGRKSRFRNIPTRAPGPRGVPHAPRTGTRTASAVTPPARPHPTSSPKVHLFYAQRV